MRDQKFKHGQIVMTPAALTSFAVSNQSPQEFLNRHLTADWGDLDEHDRSVNDHALQHGGRLLSAYKLNDATVVWIVTESNRSITTLLLPSDY